MHESKIICYKFASRSRPGKFFKAIENIFTLAKHEKYFIQCSFDIDDTTMNNEAVRNRLTQYDQNLLKWTFGVSRNKIDAINRDMEGLKFDLLINMSDDMRFLCAGFDEMILADMYTHFPDGDGMLGYWDQGHETKGKDFSTMAIMDYLYYSRTHYIYFPGFQSTHCDNDSCETGRALGRFKMCEGQVVSHDHPHNGYGEFDAQYRATEDANLFHVDRLVYEKRLAKNFYITDKILSVIILTITGREEMLRILQAELFRQADEFGAAGMIELKINPHAGSRGKKRADSLDQCTGKHVVHIDDDDKPLSQYMPCILSALASDPSIDCIGMNGFITTNGVDKRDWSISKDHGMWFGNEFRRWYEHERIYYRTPNHISPVRRELADLVSFPDKDYGEDYDYSMGILPYLKREIKINKQLYHYDFKSK